MPTGCTIGVDCATAIADPLPSDSTPAARRTAQRNAALSPPRRQPASVLAAVKGKAQAPAGGRP
ncbi:hypothetical protein [Nitratireductor aquibiodomus]|uniref:hypothetical protein n=1 Tax=Nitratireductor aquibiodomus TaxID=204799 RepID=UPI0009DF3799|nr:hypothetical protein [Nitratireductor aquibiodomus]